LMHDIGRHWPRCQRRCNDGGEPEYVANANQNSTSTAGTKR
jgi:hypothetical protein